MGDAMKKWTIAVVLLFSSVAGACGRGEAEQKAEEDIPTLDVTSWTEKTELFMEYPPLVGGQSARYAVHLTRLSDFTALTAGRPRLEFSPATGGAPVVLQGNDPSRPGVFRVEGASPPPGNYQWALIVEAPDLADRHELGNITVFPDLPSAVADANKNATDDAAAISYLKEPQWTNGFGTVPVREAEVRASLRAPATIHPLPGGEAVVAAPASGRFRTDALLSVGTRVSAGQILGRLEPRLATGADRATLEAEVAEARSALEAARIELARAERLLADRAVPARRVEDARRATGVAETRLKAAEARLTQRDETLRTGGAAGGNAFALRAPIAGRIAEVNATVGASYDEGEPLFKIVRTDRVELAVQVPAHNAPLAREAEGVALEIPGMGAPLTLQPHHVHDSGVIDSESKALSVQMEIDNRGERLLIGQTATAILYSRERRRMPVLPTVAVLMEAGRPYVFVQLGGEAFARRFIEIGSRDGDLVGVTSGVKPGERVVTRGAYEVQLASAASGLPAEGHVH
jgi:cobalt-zinc-cadmium efflux system membrane fusion protein